MEHPDAPVEEELSLTEGISVEGKYGKEWHKAVILEVAEGEDSSTTVKVTRQQREHLSNVWCVFLCHLFGGRVLRFFGVVALARPYFSSKLPNVAPFSTLRV